ncbi:MAG TPA: hypothetical protein VJ823_00410 [Rhodanobacteraceae bacterium]|nr:hypothetical protein [Rhodanobacteraceae bacterium]
MLSRPWGPWLLWVAPWILIVASGSLGDNRVRTGAWTFAFAVMGSACVVNARRCGRRHCFYTGPLFLLAALTSLLHGTGVLPLGRNGWNWIIGITVAGSLLACCGLEPLFGKYSGKRPPGAD